METRISASTTPITLASFKTITDSNGKFETWTDILQKAMDTLPLNTDILGTVMKSMDIVTGDNIMFENTETKNVQLFRDELGRNNKLTLNKSNMFLFTDYMLPIEYSIIDQKSAVEWSKILSTAIADMFISRNDYANQLTIETVSKVSIALGQFQIIPNGDKDVITPEGDLDYVAYKQLGLKLVKFYNRIRRIRTKFSRGFADSQVEWIIGQDFSTNLLAGKTAGNSGSNNAYKDTEKENQVQELFGITYRTNMYFGDNIGMSEFANPIGGAIINEGKGTGNLIKPNNFSTFLGMLWFRESLAFYGHNFVFTDIPQVNSRTLNILTWSYRMNAAIKPVYARLNWIFLSGMPKIESYTDFEGVVVPAADYSKVADFNKLRADLLKEQPQLYNYLGFGTPLADQTALDDLIAKNTIDWKYKDAIITKDGTPLSRKEIKALNKSE